MEFWCSFSILWGLNLGGVGDGGYIWLVVGSGWYILGGDGWCWVLVSIFWEVVGDGGWWWVYFG